jgi:hypothetical protein
MENPVGDTIAFDLRCFGSYRIGRPAHASEAHRSLAIRRQSQHHKLIFHLKYAWC